MGCILVYGDTFDFTFTLSDAVFAQVYYLLQIRIEHVDFLAVIVQFVTIALTIVTVFGATLRHQIEH